MHGFYITDYMETDRRFSNYSNSLHGATYYGHRSNLVRDLVPLQYGYIYGQCRD
eukprot:COSAG05_NODE_5643_length_1123_cov_1.625000_1_plen_54_part_00